ncbi:MAG: hypothetical protein KIS78_21870 [Labilithrix sp.]|nr:hypothetical protein [Labilithrix sp.]
MELLSIEGNTRASTAGAMFGNCPRALWEKWAPPDERHRITLACRALPPAKPRRASARAMCPAFRAGIGAFFDPKMRERRVQEDRHVLPRSRRSGSRPRIIDVVVLSHLH